MRVDTLDPYIRRTSHYYLSLTLISFIWLIIKFGYESEVNYAPSRFINFTSIFISKFLFLSIYIAIALAVLVAYQMILQNSDKFWSNLKRHARDSSWGLRVRKYNKKRNKLLTINLFVFLVLYIILVNYELSYNRIDFGLHIQLIIPVLVLCILIANFMTASRILRSSCDDVYRIMYTNIYKDEPQIDRRFWKWNIIYFNQEDRRILVNRPSGVGWTINHAHLLPAVLLYSCTILLVVIAALWL